MLLLRLLPRNCPSRQRQKTRPYCNNS
ncbi:hypothetical protein NC652_036130 [Populus alba x Populus x berolinensis]|nr:hypothetical protein NC652_036130 [Populus alba x Populus x berolinensis]